MQVTVRNFIKQAASWGGNVEKIKQIEGCMVVDGLKGIQKNFDVVEGEGSGDMCCRVLDQLELVKGFMGET